MTHPIKSLQIYHYPVTRSARAVWAAFEAASCPVEITRVDLYGAEQYGPDYLKTNPNHAVPAMVITWEDGDAKTMIESAAIVAFLGEAFPSAGVVPAVDDLRARAGYLETLAYCGAHMDMMLWQIRVHTHILGPDEADPRMAARYKNKLEAEAAPFLAAKLSAHKYMAGEAFTLADCIAVHNILWARSYSLCRDDIFSAYLARVMKRPAFMKAFSDMGEFKAQTPNDSAIMNLFTG